ncbi:HNH endonuclease [Hypnocyclicus thermotrophus]|uniref:HNH endonuclease n=1 Tax=Hypnocyclicus thermotrophus TaxID=1627895 RepID=A0AA46DZB4_9FUSO|nr:HNH endonuclease signature motif containing protein [Hypnocyclicus thermotrophus]TDT71509.1 HNH endonuclease [Hypnocyclicus thermotrophus]
MTIDMKFFNVYYFCHLANESMGEFNYARTNAEFTERQFEIEPEDFPKVSVLREYCSWLIDRVFYEQANSISNSGEVADFNPINWINQAILKYKGINVSINNDFTIDYEDFLETYNEYISYLDKFEDGLFYDVLYDIATEVEYILFQNRDFLLRFNEQQAVAFEDNPRKRVYIPEWVKRAVLFRDKGCCVFCKKDLTGLYSLLEDNEKHFDHIVSLNEGGLNDVCNIQLSCKDCNLKKSDNSKTSTLYQSAY